MKFRILTIGLLGALCAVPGLAGQMLLLPQDPDSRWILVSPPMTGAPIEKEGAPLMNSPIQIDSFHAQLALLRSPANAHRARMAFEHVRLRFPMPSDNLHYPDPDQLPLHPQKSNLAL